jgi:hypothetical protein
MPKKNPHKSRPRIAVTRNDLRLINRLLAGACAANESVIRLIVERTQAAPQSGVSRQRAT